MQANEKEVGKEVVKVENTEVMNIEQLPNQEEIVKHGRDCAKILKKIVDANPNKVMINGKQYLCYHDWQTIAKFYNMSVGTDWIKPIMVKDELFGFEAKSYVIDQSGKTVSSAISSCAKDEQFWAGKPDFQLRSMAQTRASVKALRNVFAWIVVLANYSPTPAEEMIRDEKKTVTVPSKTEPKKEGPTHSGKGCSICKKKITDSVSKFSISKYQTELCFNCQKDFKTTKEDKELEEDPEDVVM